MGGKIIGKVYGTTEMAERFTRKFNDEQKKEIIRLFAEGINYCQITSFVKDEWDIEVTTNAIRNICSGPRIQNEIRILRKEYLKKVLDVPIANGRIRLDDYQWLRDKLKAEIAKNDCKTLVDKRELLVFVRELNNILTSAREEMNKKAMLPGFETIGDFDGQTDEELIAQRDELIKRASRSIRIGVTGNNEDSEDIKGTDNPKPAEILLATSEEL